MGFICKEITISDTEFSCSIKLSDTIDPGFIEGLTMEEMLNPSDKYLLIHRSYPEDRYENDYYTIETSESDDVFGQKDRLIIKLDKSKRLLQAELHSKTLEIGLDQIEAGQIQKLEKKLIRKFKTKVFLINE